MKRRHSSFHPQKAQGKWTYSRKILIQDYTRIFICMRDSMACTFTGPAVSIQVESWVARARIRAWQISTELLAVTISAFINI